MPHTLWIVTTTVGTADDAARLARAAVERRLAACVQVDAIAASHYRWEGALCADAEWRLTLKTAAHCLPLLEQFFAEAHPYALPQFAAVEARASAAYAGWVAGEVVPSPAG